MFQLHTTTKWIKCSHAIISNVCKVSIESYHGPRTCVDSAFKSLCHSVDKIQITFCCLFSLVVHHCLRSTCGYCALAKNICLHGYSVFILRKEKVIDYYSMHEYHYVNFQNGCYQQGCCVGSQLSAITSQSIVLLFGVTCYFQELYNTTTSRV